MAAAAAGQRTEPPRAGARANGQTKDVLVCPPPPPPPEKRRLRSTCSASIRSTRSTIRRHPKKGPNSARSVGIIGSRRQPFGLLLQRRRRSRCLARGGGASRRPPQPRRGRSGPRASTWRASPPQTQSASDSDGRTPRARRPARSATYVSGRGRLAATGERADAPRVRTRILWLVGLGDLGAS
jgi:hypothetical protein